MPNWLATFPQQPVLGSVSMASPASFKTKKVAKGPSKSRRITSSAPEPFTATYEPLSETDLRDFYDWWANQIGEGSLPFTMPHPLLDDPVTVKFSERAYSIRQKRGRNFHSMTVNMEIQP